MSAESYDALAAHGLIGGNPRLVTVAAGAAVPSGTPDGTLFVEYTP